MSEQQNPRHPLADLFHPGERLGWIFRDRWGHLRPFTDPPPAPPPVPPELVHRHETARQQLTARMLTAVGIGAGTTAGIGCLAACLGLSADSPTTPFYILAGIAVLGTGAAMALVYAHYRAAAQAVGAAQRHGAEWYGTAQADWAQRKAEFDALELRRVDAMPEWGAARVAAGTRRFDVFGGTPWGWEALPRPSARR